MALSMAIALPFDLMNYLNGYELYLIVLIFHAFVLVGLFMELYMETYNTKYATIVVLMILVLQVVAIL